MVHNPQVPRCTSSEPSTSAPDQPVLRWAPASGTPAPAGRSLPSCVHYHGGEQGGAGSGASLA